MKVHLENRTHFQFLSHNRLKNNQNKINFNLVITRNSYI